MINASEIRLRIYKLEVLKKRAEGNVHRIRKHIKEGFQTKTAPDNWIKLSNQYQSEINQLKNQLNGNNKTEGERERNHGSR